MEEWHAGTLLARTKRHGAAAGAKETYDGAREWKWLVYDMMVEVRDGSSRVRKRYVMEVVEFERGT